MGEEERIVGGERVEERVEERVGEEVKERVGERAEEKKNTEHITDELIRSLFRILPKERKALVKLMCKSVGKCENLATLAGGCSIRPLQLYNMQLLCAELELSNVTVRKLVRDFIREGLVEVKTVGKSKIVLPTSKLIALCERLKGEIE